MPEDEDAECRGNECEQMLYCAPALINELTGKFSIVACDCSCVEHAKSDGLEAYVEYIEGFIELADTEGSGVWYHTHLLKDWVKKQKLIIFKETVTMTIRRTNE
jgi:hypothetical protein